MGFNDNMMQYMELVKYRYGINYKYTAMLGRASLAISDSHCRQVFGDFEIKQEDGYSEKFLKYLGAESVVSFDNSNYENCTYIHDFNQPIEVEFEEKYTTVLDGGSLEHIFNFPIAIHNLMKMVCLGGNLIIESPVNNHCGHGLYQFSPDLYERVLTANGFVIEDMTWEDTDYENLDEDIKIKTYKMTSYVVPRKSKYNSLIRICAKKIAKTPQKLECIMQTDYERIWGGELIASEQKFFYYDVTRELLYLRNKKDIRHNKKVLFWGGGKNFEDFIKNLENMDYKDNILACIDLDINKQGTTLYGIDIVSPEVIEKEVVYNYIISSSKYYEDIKNKLMCEFNIEEEKILTLSEYKYYCGDCIYKIKE